MTEYHGQLELTWTNKDLCLLAADDGSYEWVSPAEWLRFGCCMTPEWSERLNDKAALYLVKRTHGGQ
jgi:hypothetical protein